MLDLLNFYVTLGEEYGASLRLDERESKIEKSIYLMRRNRLSGDRLSFTVRQAIETSRDSNRVKLVEKIVVYLRDGARSLRSLINKIV